ncbi:hypothetical protein LCGC14_2970240, partial [marine sediment metagenome]
LASRFSTILAAYGANTSAITTEQTARANADSAMAVDIALMGAANGADTAFIMDSSTVKIDSDGGDSFATRLTALATADSNNSAAITSEATTRGSADDGFSAHYGVSLNVNGYITGFTQLNDGTSGEFTILADKFAIVHPHVEWAATTAYTLGQTRHPTTPDGNVYECTTAGTSGGSEPTWDTTPGNTTNDNTVVWTAITQTALVPFSVAGGVVTMQNVIINGSLVVAGTITGDHIEANAVTDEDVSEDWSSLLFETTPDTWTTLLSATIVADGTSPVLVNAGFSIGAMNSPNGFYRILRTSSVIGAEFQNQQSSGRWAPHIFRRDVPPSGSTTYYLQAKDDDDGDFTVFHRYIHVVQIKK